MTVQIRQATSADLNAFLELHAQVHDLHVWSLSSNLPLLSAHVEVADGADADATCRALSALLRERFGIGHTTLQMESMPCDDHGCE